MIHAGSDDALELLGGYAAGGTRLDNVMHHVGGLTALRVARKLCREGAAAGSDGEVLAAVNLAQLSAEVLSGHYRPRRDRWLDIAKPSGVGTRRIVVPCARDKIVQTALARVLRAVWSPFDVEAVNVSFARHAAHRAARWYHWRRCRWVYETDLARCFDTLRRDRLMAALARKVSDRRFLRLVSTVVGRDVGVPQGYACAPALCDVYLWHAVDRWWLAWRRAHARGATFAARYVDDAVFGFEHGEELDAFVAAFRAHLAACGLSEGEGRTAARRARGPLRFLGLWRDGHTNRPVKLRARIARATGSPASVGGLLSYYRLSCSRRSLRSLRRARQKRA